MPDRDAPDSRDPVSTDEAGPSTTPPLRIDDKAARERFEAALADHEQVFERFFLSRLMGLEFEYLPHDAPDEAKDVCRLRFPVQPFLFNPQGTSLHGGIMTAAMDIAMGHLVKKVVGDGMTATIELKMQFMRPLSGGWATCEGRFLRRGRGISFLEARMWDDKDRAVAHATATWKMPG